MVLALQNNGPHSLGQCRNNASISQDTNINVDALPTVTNRTRVFIPCAQKMAVYTALVLAMVVKLGILASLFGRPLLLPPKEVAYQGARRVRETKRREAVAKLRARVVVVLQKMPQKKMTKITLVRDDLQMQARSQRHKRGTNGFWLVSAAGIEIQFACDPSRGLSFLHRDLLYRSSRSTNTPSDDTGSQDSKTMVSLSFSLAGYVITHSIARTRRVPDNHSCAAFRWLHQSLFIQSGSPLTLRRPNSGLPRSRWYRHFS